jgi:hypothetical protein
MLGHHITAAALLAISASAWGKLDKLTLLGIREIGSLPELVAMDPSVLQSSPLPHRIGLCC